MRHYTMHKGQKKKKSKFSSIVRWVTHRHLFFRQIKEFCLRALCFFLIQNFSKV